MSHRLLVVATLLSLPVLSACGEVDLYTLGADDGVPPISGSTTIDVPQDYQCGDAISDPEGKYVVTSSGTADHCTFNFHQDVLAIQASDYSDNPELEGAQAVSKININVSAFNVIDPATNERPTGLLSLDGKAFDTTILTEADLDTPPPFTVTIEGEPVDQLKDQVQNKEDIIIPVDVVVEVDMTPTPASIQLDFDAQPEIVLGF
ncbi:MAG: hypothetical protein U0271_40325 [Polyangiaceae bacterium]